MKKKFKILIAAALAAVLLGGVGYALAPDDSLLTLSYLTEQFLPVARKRGEEAGAKKLQETYDQAKDKLDKVQQGLRKESGRESGTLYNATLAPMELHDGEMIEVSAGGSVLMQEGAAVVNHNGAFIDATTGTEIPTGSKLVYGHRYLAGENTTARIEVMSGAARMGVQSEYLRSGGVSNPTPFYDVSRLDWYSTQVNYVFNKNYFAGVSEHEFGGGVLMNRAMVMTVFYKMAGQPEDEMEAASHVSFRDVPEDKWYAPFIKWAADQKITSGTGPDTFSPDELISREQFVQLLYNFSVHYMGKDLSKRADLSVFEDRADISAWAVDAVSWGVSEGLLKSMSGSKQILMPRGYNDRVAIAVMLYTFDH